MGFTVIANNCWGAEIYKELNLPYNTPFIGLFIPPKCYLDFLENIAFYIQQPLEFINQSKYSYYNSFRLEQGLNYPIGILGKRIEIHFLHYQSEAEALEKWQRRVARLNLDVDQLFIKFCDREVEDISLIERFDQLPYLNKVCFTVKRHRNLKSAVWIYENRNLKEVIDGKSLYSVSKRYFNVLRWINSGNGKLKFKEKIYLLMYLTKIQISALKRRLC